MDITGDDIVQLLTTVDTTIDIDESNLTPIQKFYKNTNVFITGVTGFLGQILLEKLLRSCPISTVYVLMREKKGKTIETRLEEIFEDPLFQRIKNQFPETRQKVVPIVGECSLPDLGLSDRDKQLLMDQVDIIFHVAATVRFDEKLKTAVLTNVRAPRDLLRIAQKTPRLKSFMHVSTAYSNCIHKTIEEEIYPPVANYKGIITMAESLPANILNNVTPKIVGKYPNTYTITKQIAEDMVKTEGQGLPIGIHRPSIVISTYKEPIRGWINNLYGPTGVGAGAGVGLLRVLPCDPHCNANVVPADMCVNSIVAAAWDVAEAFNKVGDKKSDFKIPVYNFESSTDKPIDWAFFMESGVRYGLKNPPLKCLWYYCLFLVKYYPLALVLMFFLHTIPAFMVDGVRLCMGKPAMLTAAYKKIHKFSNAISFFCMNEWVMNSKRIQEVVAKMTERDRKIFFFDLKQIDWDDFFKCGTLGGRTYLLKEPLDTLPAARKRYRMLYWCHQGLKFTMGLLLVWLMWSLVSFIALR